MNAIIAFALKQRMFLAILLPLMLLGGSSAFRQLNIEAYPDPVPPLVDIVTQSSGPVRRGDRALHHHPDRSADGRHPARHDRADDLAVRPVGCEGAIHLRLHLRAGGAVGHQPPRRSCRTLPNGALPQISPTSPIGEIYRYRVVGPPGYSVTDLKTLEDWVLERRFKAVPGVIDVTGWGGKTKTYEITVDQHRLCSTACRSRRCCRRSTTATSTSAARRSTSVRRPPSCAESV